MNRIFDDVNTFLLCDESKFYVKNGDFDDAIYYFSVAIPKNLKNQLESELLLTLQHHRVQAPIYHSTTIFKKRYPRAALMRDICNLIVRYKLHCYCFKYSRPLLFEVTKRLSYLNSDIFDFNNDEFQAVFYFLIMFNTYLRDEDKDLEKKFGMFFDRNHYGKEKTEEFYFPEKFYVIKFMTFVEKSIISLLALPDYFGYVFRQAKLSKNKVEAGDYSLETSKLVINCYASLLRIQQAGLFHFLDMDEKIDAFAVILASYTE